MHERLTTRCLYAESTSLTNQMHQNLEIISVVNVSEIEISDVQSVQKRIKRVSEAYADEIHFQVSLENKIGEFLKRQVLHNDLSNLPEQRSSPFYGDCPPFTASYYIKRIARYSGTSSSCLIAALLYLDRIQTRVPECYLSSCTLQRLLLVSAMIATKYLEDTSVLNKHWAEIGGLSLKELNALEVEFLIALDFDFRMRQEEYCQIVDRLYC